MRRPVVVWLPPSMLVVGVVLATAAEHPQANPLRQSLGAVIATDVLGWHGDDLALSDDEEAVVGMDAYLLRAYETTETEQPVGLYVGYYERQTAGRVIHSPKNCLPGGGWEPLRSSLATLSVDGDRPVRVNRYVLQNNDRQVLVLYWYQGRGRVSSNEYAVKWHLMRDAALTGRTEEALVRIVVPIEGEETDAYALAEALAQYVIPALDQALPT